MQDEIRHRNRELSFDVVLGRDLTSSDTPAPLLDTRISSIQKVVRESIYVQLAGHGHNGVYFTSQLDAGDRTRSYP